jgi:hypothetical protein
MNRAWNTYMLFSLLVASFWRAAMEAGLDTDELFEALARRLRVNLIARSLR